MREYLSSSARWHVEYDYPPVGVGRMSQQVETSASASVVQTARSWPGARLAEAETRRQTGEDLRAFVWLLLAMALCVGMGLFWCYVGAVLVGLAR